MNTITFKKESAIDYSIEKDGKHIGWITKDKNGAYNVNFIDMPYVYNGFRYLKDAKAFAKENA